MTVVPEGTHAGATSLDAFVANDSDGRLDDNSDLEETPVTAATDVVVELEPSRPSFIVGRPAAYTATVRNVLPTDAQGEVTLEISLDFEMSIGGFTAPAPWDCSPSGTRFLACTHPGPIDTALPSVTIDVAVASTFSNSAFTYASVRTLGDDITGNNFTQLQTPVAGETDLTVEIGEPPAAATFAQPWSVPITVRNTDTAPAGGSCATRRRTVRSASENLTGSSADAAWSCAPFMQTRCAANTPDRWPDRRALAPVVVTGTPGRTGTPNEETTLHAEVVGEFDGNRDNDFDSLTFTIAAPVDLAVAIDDGDASFPITGAGAYDIDLTNLGSAPAPGPTTVSVHGLASNVTNVIASPRPGSAPSDFGIRECTYPDPIAAGATVTLTLSFTVAPTSANEMFVSAEVSHPADARFGNDFQSESTPLVEHADFVVAVTDGDEPFTAPGTGQYAIVVRTPASGSGSGPIRVEVDVLRSGRTRLRHGLGMELRRPPGQFACTHAGPVGAGAIVPSWQSLSTST